MKKQILVTGGAGYIGSHTVKQLGEAGYEIIIYDNLSTGATAAVTYGKLVTGDLADKSRLHALFTDYDFDAVLHFAHNHIQLGSYSHGIVFWVIWKKKGTFFEHQGYLLR